ncbi:hypothetical protein TNCV_3421071 [Trichonephila clavipes]|nr:hypothetical protein TNCV_3421071 [Trichonephila clavipes]
MNHLTARQALPWSTRTPNLSPIKHVWDMMGRDFCPFLSEVLLVEKLHYGNEWCLVHHWHVGRPSLVLVLVPLSTRVFPHPSFQVPAYIKLNGTFEKGMLVLWILLRSETTNIIH